METSILLAKIFGLTYIVVGLGMLINKEYYHKLFKEYLKNESLVYFGGVAALVVGIVILSFHNYWVSSWEVIITVFGWMALIKGILLLLVPKALIDLFRPWFKNETTLTLFGLLALVIGVVLGYFGFIAYL